MRALISEAEVRWKYGHKADEIDCEVWFFCSAAAPLCAAGFAEGADLLWVSVNLQEWWIAAAPSLIICCTTFPLKGTNGGFGLLGNRRDIRRWYECWLELTSASVWGFYCFNIVIFSPITKPSHKTLLFYLQNELTPSSLSTHQCVCRKISFKIYSKGLKKSLVFKLLA